MSRQIPLPLKVSGAFSRENFIVSACNRNALALVEQFPDWGSYGAVIIGEKASGKSHLGHVWMQRAQAYPLSQVELATPLPNVLVDDAEQVDAPTLFHLLNAIKEQGKYVLITCSTLPTLWAQLPDVASRLKSLPTQTLDAPDDAALAALITQLCHTQGLQVSEEAMRYLLPRIERSFSGASALAERLHNEALAQKRTLTVPFLSAIFNQ